MASLKSLLFSETSKDTGVVFGGTVINALFGALFFVLAPRILGPENFGLFSVVTATGVMIAAFANLSIDTGILRFASGKDQDQVKKILSLALKTYLVIGIAVFLLGQPFAPLLGMLLKEPQIVPLLRIAFSGIILILLSNFFIATLQAKKEFTKAAIIGISANIVRVVVLALGAYFLTVGLYAITVLFYAVTLTSIIIGRLFVPLDFLKEKSQSDLSKKFYFYNLWIALSMIIASVPLDQYFLVRFSGAQENGIFAAPQKLTLIFGQLAGNFTTVLAPRFASFDTFQKAKTFIAKSLPIAILISLLILGSSILAVPIIKVLFGSQYLESASVYRILALSSSIKFLSTVPISIIIYYFAKTKIVFFATAINFLVWIFSAPFLITRLGAQGAAWAWVIWETIALTFFVIYILLRKQQE